MAEESTPPPRPVRRGDRPRPRRQPPPELSIGTRVAGYLVERRLGAGGYGTVYLARGDTGPVALKVLPLESSAGWEEREVDVIRRMKHPRVVRLLGYVDWPEGKPHFRVLIMEYVPGLPLDESVRRTNPSALEAVDELMLPLLEALEAVHGSGVVHRDVKASNILVRASDRKPVLVDFGAGAYEGAPTLTTSVLPPGTPEYRSPEAWDFFRRHVGEAGARYQPTPADDLWAVGILLYWVLTDRLPFSGGDFLAIGAAVLNERPVPPREHNPWVPEALERVCLRMLEKSPGARYADARELRTVLCELKATADASWREPLFEHHGPHNATTGSMEQLAEGEDLSLRLSRLAQQPPRRGEGPTQEASAVPEAAPPTQTTSPTPPVVDAATPAEAPSPGLQTRLGRKLRALTPGVLVLAAALWFLPSWSTQVSSEVGPATQPFMSPEVFPIQWDAFFPDVVPSLKPPDVVGNAAPNGQAVASPVLNARHSEKDMHEKKTSRKPTPSPQARKARPSLMFCLSLSVTAALAAGCASTSPITREFYEQYIKNPPPYPEPEDAWLVECPPESVKNMKENGVTIGSIHPYATFGGGYGQRERRIPLSELPDTMSVPMGGTGVELRERWGNFMMVGVIMGGSIIKGDRVYTRLINYSGLEDNARQVPVCMEVWHEGKLGTPNLGLDPDQPGFVKVPSRIQLKAVSHFD
ncbi:serine/threonine protein kinase [Archangium lansingense]|uniref:serine/threonine protein kinase n=1 Tax=Archangium lansingense TaxID=2995310 RepID=UPI003B7D14EF